MPFVAELGRAYARCVAAERELSQSDRGSPQRRFLEEDFEQRLLSYGHVVIHAGEQQGSIKPLGTSEGYVVYTNHAPLVMKKKDGDLLLEERALFVVAPENVNTTNTKTHYAVLWHPKGKPVAANRTAYTIIKSEDELLTYQVVSRARREPSYYSRVATLTLIAMLAATISYGRIVSQPPEKVLRGPALLICFGALIAGVIGTLYTLRVLPASRLPLQRCRGLEALRSLETLTLK